MNAQIGGLDIAEFMHTQFNAALETLRKGGDLLGTANEGSDYALMRIEGEWRIARPSGIALRMDDSSKTVALYAFIGFLATH